MGLEQILRPPVPMPHTYNNAGRDGVEHGENPNPHDQLLQLVRLAAVLLHEGADLDEGEEAHGEEDGTDADVDDEGGDEEPAQAPHVPQAHKTRARQHVTLHLLQDLPL